MKIQAYPHLFITRYFYVMTSEHAFYAIVVLCFAEVGLRQGFASITHALFKSAFCKIFAVNRCLEMVCVDNVVTPLRVEKAGNPPDPHDP
jgi:hypothetical protein